MDPEDRDEDDRGVEFRPPTTGSNLGSVMFLLTSTSSSSEEKVFSKDPPQEQSRAATVVVCPDALAAATAQSTKLFK